MDWGARESDCRVDDEQQDDVPAFIQDEGRIPNSVDYVLLSNLVLSPRLVRVR
jgi:hypothetical protein